MALTLLEVKKRADTTVQESAVIDYFAEASTLLQYVTLRNIDGNSISYSMVDKLPGVAFRGINEGYTESTGIMNQQVETLYSAGGDLDVDRRLIDMATGDADVRAQEEKFKVEALALFINKKLIKGDNSVDPREFDGLQKRIVNQQLIPATIAGTRGPLSQMQLDRAIKRTNRRGRTVMIMNSEMALRMTKYARGTAGGPIGTAITEWGQQVDTYAGIPIVETDIDNDGNDILGFDEAGPDGGTESTSIYIVSFGRGLCEMLQGRVNGKFGIDVRDLGMLESKPTFRTRVEWDMGLMIQHGRAASRIYGITQADLTA